MGYTLGRILEGRSIANGIKRELHRRAEEMKLKRGFAPGLAIVTGGRDQASVSYAKNAARASEAAGIRIEIHTLGEGCETPGALNAIEALNQDERTDGILMQFPLPDGVDEKAVRSGIRPAKDIECINPLNMGRFYGGEKCFVPCTPKGIMRLIEHTGVRIEGKHAVVIGRSGILGKPVAALLLKRNATVTVCHSKSIDLGRYTRDADILVSASGKPGLVTADMIKRGAVVIDSGTTMVDGRLVGDAVFDDILKVASWITPVPGGVGAMTVAMLLENVLEACEHVY